VELAFAQFEQRVGVSRRIGVGAGVEAGVGVGGAEEGDRAGKGMAAEAHI